MALAQLVGHTKPIPTYPPSLLLEEDSFRLITDVVFFLLCCVFVEMIATFEVAPLKHILLTLGPLG